MKRNTWNQCILQTQKDCYRQCSRQHSDGLPMCEALLLTLCPRPCMSGHNYLLWNWIKHCIHLATLNENSCYIWHYKHTIVPTGQEQKWWFTGWLLYNVPGKDLQSRFVGHIWDCTNKEQHMALAWKDAKQAVTVLSNCQNLFQPQIHSFRLTRTQLPYSQRIEHQMAAKFLCIPKILKCVHLGYNIVSLNTAMVISS